jgi:glycosyltransferase involved in cell wall biosynthesis
MEKKVLIISEIVGSGWLLGKSLGSQAFPQTVMGYGNAGWNVTLLAGHKRLGLKKEYFITPNVKVIHSSKNVWRIRKFLLNARPFFIFRNIWWLCYQVIMLLKAFRLARKKKFDLFYGYEIHGIIVAKILSVIFKKPVIFRYQGTKIPFYKEQRFWKFRYFSHILAMKLKANLYIMTNDGTTGENILLGYGVPKGKIKFWTNGVPENIFERIENANKAKEELGFKHEDKIILSVSRVEKWKRIDRTVRAMPEVIKKHPNTYFLMVGWGNEKENLENLSKKLKLENNVKFLGSVPNDELRKYYSICDIFVSMYDISNVGNPLLEALCQQTCIVTLNVGDTNKFIKNNNNGILLEKEEIKKLPEYIIALLNEPEKRRKLSENARDFAIKNLWTWDKRIKAEIDEANNLIFQWQKK